MEEVTLTPEECIVELLEASRYGEIPETQAMLDAKVDVNSADSTGRTALFFAAANGHLEVVQLLLKNGADPTLKNEEGNTALHWAALNGKLEVAKALMDAGAEPTAVNQKDMSPLDEAIRGGHDEVMFAINEVVGGTIEDGDEEGFAEEDEDEAGSENLGRGAASGHRPVAFPTSTGGEAGRWCPDGRGQGTHVKAP